MMFTLRRYLAIALMRESPANLPASSGDVVFSICFALASYVFVGSLGDESMDALNRGVIDLMLSAALVFLTLRVFEKGARFNQAFSAFCGSSGIVNLVAMPLMWRLANLPEGVDPGIGFALPWLLLMGWVVAVQAHILRATLECGRPLAVSLAMGYLVIALTVFDLIY